MLKTLKDFNVKGKKVLVRCDFNVPLNVNGGILDDFRILQVLPTVQYLIKSKAKVILMSHLADPKGRIVENLRLDNIKNELKKLLDVPVSKADDCVGKEVENRVSKVKSGEVLLLENLRFHKEETNNDPGFAKKLSKLGEIYINEAFSVCHRQHASIVGVPKYLPHGAGFLLEKEIKNLNKILGKSLPAGKQAKRPLVVIIGGKKVETKSEFIDKISEIADSVIISGLIKKEIVDKKIEFKNSNKIISPIDNFGALDISEKTIGMFREKILKAKMIVWNGPFGKFEDENFKNGTLQIAKAIIQSKAFSVVGGGETIEFLKKEGMIDQFNHVSTGGGAMLSYLAGEKLPGLKALQ